MTANYDTQDRAQGPWQRRGCGAFRNWRPVEIGALVLGFAIWWPLGLAVLGWKLAERKGYAMPDVFGAAKSRFDSFAGGFGTAQGKRWRPFEQTTGNAAFDEWRRAEMEKLDEQRRRLDEAEREFAAHMDNLRRARDREEFDRFMAARGGNTQA